ncbi:hypothetical protein ACPC54_24715 [Kitasatospora sp. NPDC094028]
MRRRITGTVLLTAALLGTATTAHAATTQPSAPRAAAAVGFYGGKYANYRDCTAAGSLAIGLGLYNGYVCDPVPGSKAYWLYYR